MVRLPREEDTKSTVWGGVGRRRTVEQMPSEVLKMKSPIKKGEREPRKGIDSPEP